MEGPSFFAHTKFTIALIVCLLSKLVAKSVRGIARSNVKISNGKLLLSEAFVDVDVTDANV